MTEDQAQEINKDMDACIVGEARRIAKELTGGNCAFVDDDIKVMARLALWALENGVPDDLIPDIIPRAKAHLAATTT